MQDIGKKYKKARMFLAIDILNFNEVGKGEINNIIMDVAEEYCLGVIFATKNMCWVVPAEFLLA